MLFPFLALLASPDTVLSSPVIQGLGQFVGLSDPSGLTLVIMTAFCLAALLSGAVRLLVLYANNRYSFALGAELSAETYRRTLYQPYTVHVSRNSSSLIDGIMNRTMAVTSNVVLQFLNLLSSSMIGLSIVAALLFTDARVAMITGGAFTAIYIVILAVSRGQLKRNSETIARGSGRAMKALQEGLGGIRDVLIDSTQETFAQIYQAADRPYKMAMSRNTFIAGSPRFVVETFGMILIAILAFSLTREDGGMSDAIPVLGVLALGAQRLMPMLQLIYSSVATIRGNEASLDDVMALLDQPMPPAQPEAAEVIEFERFVELRGVNFSYSSGGASVLHSFSLRIDKGAKVGVFGATGGGKSTMLDIVMGLLSPSAGGLFVDGTPIDDVRQPSWRRHVAHVPQSIFLSDSTIAENIAFGIRPEEIDMERVRDAARVAQIDDTIAGWPQAYQTPVGERGTRISGGQRQRIGVARALYKQADLIILDEATSALDNTTEEALMRAIDGLEGNVTVLMVAHRLTTLRNCDLLIEIANGRIVRTGSYDALVGSTGKALSK